MNPSLLDALATRVSQAEFAQAVGVSEARVSQLAGEGLLRSGATAGEWLAAYCERLRQQAAGRDPDGELSVERARVARETADKIAMQNALTRRELVPLAALEAVLTAVAQRIVQKLDAVVPLLRRTHPSLPASALAQVAKALNDCREDCARVNLADADAPDDEEDGEDGAC